MILVGGNRIRATPVPPHAGIPEPWAQKKHAFSSRGRLTGRPLQLTSYEVACKQKGSGLGLSGRLRLGLFGSEGLTESENDPKGQGLGRAGKLADYSNLRLGA